MQEQSLENSVSTYYSNSEDGDGMLRRNVGNHQHPYPEDLKVAHPFTSSNNVKKVTG